MEDKQLDFNRPLLSVRRFASTPEFVERKRSANSPSKIPRLPVYKSELKSGPVSKSGTVPFKWEHSPGQPKDEKKSQASILGRLTTAAPKLPPGRVSRVKHQSAEHGLHGIMVPPSQTGTTPSVSQNMSWLDMNAKDQYETSNGEMEETGCSCSEDADEAFTDALDTLSRTESFNLNCRISGVCGLDAPAIIPSRNFSSDPQAWDFMMGRFLPAAKAMASETPPYATRKTPTAQDFSSNKQMAAQLDKQTPVSPFSLKNFCPHGPDYELGKSEDEDDLSEPEDLSTKACGLVPQFLLKSSLCLLNPVPGMKMQTKKPVSIRSIRTKSSYLGNSSEIDNEHVSAFVKGSRGQLQTKEHHVDKSELNSKPSQISVRGYSQQQDGSTLHRDLQENNISAHPRGRCCSTHQDKGFPLVSEQSRICRADEFEAHEGKGNSFGKLLMSPEGSERKSVSAAPVAEKTILDPVRSPDSRSPAKIKLMGSRQDFGIEKNMRMKETLLIDSSVEVIKDLNLNSEKVELQGKTMESVDSYILLSLCKSTDDHELQMDAANGSRRDCKLIQDSSKSTCLKLAKNEKIDLKRQFIIGPSNEANPDKFGRTNGAEHARIEIGSSFHGKSSNVETSYDSCSQPPLALPLPLPKSPSESWLSRALPVVSSKNSSSRSTLGTHNYSRSKAFKELTSDPKWENRVQHGNFQFFEKFLSPILED